MEPGTLALLVLAAAFAGFVDSIVGGGGAVTLPALLAVGMPPHLAVGTNKVVGTGASGVATWQYLQAGLVQGRLVWALFPLAAAASVAGAATVLRVPAEFILRGATVVLAILVLWVLLRPRFGGQSTARAMTRWALAGTVAMVVCVAFYDGLLGPGTGMFLLFGLVAITGLPFLQAAAHGRVLNLASNLGALVFFGLAGNVDWRLGGLMAVGTVAGGFVGSRFGIRHGARWVRPLFLVVAVALLVRLATG